MSSPSVQPSSTPSESHAERVLLSMRPAPASVAAGPMWYWVLLGLAALTGAMTNGVWDKGGVLWPLACGALVVMGLVRLGWEVAGWFATRYELTDRRALVRWGVLTRAEVSIPLDKVQSVAVVRRLRDRLLGIGSVGITSAGVGDGTGIDVWWVMTADAEKAAAAVRERIPRPAAPPGAETARAGAGARAGGPIVVGLTGSIGAGKTTAAGMLREMGCVVVDSDAEAREALDRPEVRETVASWWGPGVLDASGKVDRRAVGAIVFERPEERARLERLVHPLVRKSRAAFIERAAAEGASVVVVDVPLLYEAGVDRECDAVVYVDAPREERLRRVAARGWTEAELARREAAQRPVAEKKGRADERVENAGTEEELRRALAAVLGRIQARPRRSAGA